MLLSKPYNHEISILSVDIQKGDFVNTPIYTLDNLKINELIVLGEHIYMATLVENKPVFLHIDLPNRKTNTFSFESRGENRFNPISIDSESQLVHLPVTNLYQGCYTTILHSYFKGKSINKITLPKQENKNLINAQWFPLLNQTHFIIGNYNLNIQREISQGLFAGQVNNQGSFKTIRYHDYATNQDYFGYLDKEDQEAMREKITKIQSANKDFHLRYHSQPQRLQRFKDKIIVIDNAFDINLSPKRYSSTRTYVNLPRGWYYSHSTISAFSLGGKLLWTNSVAIDQLKPEKDQHLLQTGYRDNIILSAFLDKNQIHYQKHHINGDSFEKCYKKNLLC